MYILGIDPGFTGALALFNPSTSKLQNVLDMPIITSELFLKASKEVDIKVLAAHIATFADHITLAVLERVHSMPDQGVASTFRFGEGYGMIQGILASNGIRTLMPPPSVWKLQMNVTYDKNTSLNLARSKVSPDDALKYFSRKKDNGRAEAFLLALFGARSLGFNF